MGAAECGRVVVWVAGLCAAAAASALLAVLPRDREGFDVGLAGAVVLGVALMAAWHVSTVCRPW